MFQALLGADCWLFPAAHNELIPGLLTSGTNPRKPQSANLSLCPDSLIFNNVQKTKHQMSL